MSKKHHHHDEMCNCSDESVGISVKVDVAQIMKYVCVAGVIIVAIIFGTRCVTQLLKNNDLV